jgi:hypothetical protein
MGVYPNLSLLFVAADRQHWNPLVLTIPFSFREYTFLEE